jgi:hypothetical protein
MRSMRTLPATVMRTVVVDVSMSDRDVACLYCETPVSRSSNMSGNALAGCGLRRPKTALIREDNRALVELLTDQCILRGPMPSVHEGGCLCGDVRYQTTAAPLWATICHCTFCQRFTGSAFLVEPIFRREDVAFFGAPRIYDHRSDGSDKRVSLIFCGRCGTTLYLDLERFPNIWANAEVRSTTPTGLIAVRGNVATSSRALRRAVWCCRRVWTPSGSMRFNLTGRRTSRQSWHMPSWCRRSDNTTSRTGTDRPFAAPQRFRQLSEGTADEEWPTFKRRS